MDLQTCLNKMKLVGVLAFATVDSEGAPQIRNISAIHYEPADEKIKIYLEITKSAFKVQQEYDINVRKKK